MKPTKVLSIRAVLIAVITAVIAIMAITTGCTCGEKEKTTLPTADRETIVETATDDELVVMRMVEIDYEGREYSDRCSAGRGRGLASQGNTAGQEDLARDMQPTGGGGETRANDHEYEHLRTPDLASAMAGSDNIADWPELTDSQRIAGKTQFVMPRSIQIKMDQTDLNAISLTVRICISKAGEPKDVEIVKSSGFDVADETVKETILNTWRYAPYKVAGDAIPYCERATFRYELEQDEVAQLIL